MVAAAVIAYLNYDADAVYEWMSGDIRFGAPPPASCNLHTEACTSTMGDGTVLTLEIAPRNPIPVMTKLRFTLKGEMPAHKTLKFEIFGMNMNMGRYSYTFEKESDGVYTTQGVIPSCTGPMQWRANIISDTTNGRQGAYYIFSTE